MPTRQTLDFSIKVDRLSHLDWRDVAACTATVQFTSEGAMIRSLSSRRVRLSIVLSAALAVVATAGTWSVPSTASAATASFGPGTYRVGSGISAGTYRTRSSVASCYWERLKGFSGDLDDIIANDFSSGYQVVTIKSTDKGFSSSRCGRWSSNLSRVTTSYTKFGQGTFIVGTDMAPGTYRSSKGDGCYWARLRGFGGTLSEIIANDFRNGGQAIVSIKAADKGFTSSRCGTWTKI